MPRVVFALIAQDAACRSLRTPKAVTQIGVADKGAGCEIASSTLKVFCPMTDASRRVLLSCTMRSGIYIYLTTSPFKKSTADGRFPMMNSFSWTVVGAAIGVKSIVASNASGRPDAKNREFRWIGTHGFSC